MEMLRNCYIKDNDYPPHLVQLASETRGDPTLKNHHCKPYPSQRVLLASGFSDNRHSLSPKKQTMKKSILTALVALLSIIAITSGRASTFVPNQTNAALGDLMLGFETTGGGGSKNLVIDLGSVTNTAALDSLNVNLYGDLTNTFGTNFASTVSYALYSVSTSKTIWASASNNVTTGYPLVSSGTAGTQKNDFANLLATYNADGFTQTTSNGVYEGVSEQYSWGSFSPSSGAFNNANYANIDVAIGSTAKLFEMLTSTTGGNGIYYNVSFDVSSSGELTATAVPEPSTNAFMGIGVLALVGVD